MQGVGTRTAQGGGDADSDAECTERYIYLRPWEWCFKSCRYKLSRSDPRIFLISGLLLLLLLVVTLLYGAPETLGASSGALLLDSGYISGDARPSLAAPRRFHAPASGNAVYPLVSS